MTRWTTVDEVRSAVERLWDRGQVLMTAWGGAGVDLPFRVPLRGPSSAQWSEEFDKARRWIASLDGLPLVWREFNHPRLGANRVPVAAEWSTVESLVAFLGKEVDLARFLGAANLVVARFPALQPWVEASPLSLLERHDHLDRLLDVVEWMASHPRSGLFLRQIDVPGVHTKFVEAHRGLLTSWLDLVLPAEAVDAAQKGVARFAERYGFATKPRFVRFRPLDPSLGGPQDLLWRLEDWLDWNPGPQRLVIVENEVTYLSLPPLAQTWAVFGAGYGFEGWGRSSWLAQCDLFYWGDLDTHGFAILDQLRAVAPHTRSVLMDETTLVDHREFWGREESPTSRNLTRLTDAEQAVYQGLVGDRWAPQLRLEQELVGYRFVCESLESMT